MPVRSPPCVRTTRPVAWCSPATRPGSTGSPSPASGFERPGNAGWQAGRMAAVTVRYWAGAARAAGIDSEQLDAATLAELREVLSSRPPLAAVCRVASFLVDGARAAPAAPLAPGAV